MDNTLKVGLTYEIEETVTMEKTASALGSGGVDVLATPYMIALMEKASSTIAKNELSDEENTVGTKVDIEHCSATPVGMKITVKSRLIEVEGRKLVFEVEAFDEKGKIGFGKHERFIINTEKFMNKTNSKLQ